MRNFNDEERKILELLVYDSEKVYETAILRKRISVLDLLEGMAKDLEVQIDIDTSGKKLVLRSDKFGYRLKDGQKLPIIYENWGEHLYNAFYKIEDKIVLIISLLDYLEKNHLIYIFPLDEKKDDSIKLNKDFVFPIPDYIPSYGNLITANSSKFDYIYENLFDSIITTSELKEFVKNNFKDKEQLRHEENVNLQKTSLEQAQKSTKAATRLGNISILIAALSFIAAIMALVPESRRQQLFGIKGKQEPSKQQIDVIRPDTTSNNKVKVTVKKDSVNVKPSIKPIIPDTLKN